MDLTLANPLTIMSFIALFVGLGVSGEDAGGAAVLTVGVLVGSSAWWVLLVGAVGALRGRLTPAWMRRINIASGLLIGAFAIMAIATSITG